MIGATSAQTLASYLNVLLERLKMLGGFCFLWGRSPFSTLKLAHICFQGLSEVEEVSGLENGPVVASTGN